MALLLDESRGSAAPAASVDVLALDGSRRGKFSRHLVLRVHTALDASEAPLSSLSDAAAFARRVHARLLTTSPAAAALIDLQVYASRRCFRLLQSAKLSNPSAVPLEVRRARCTPAACARLSGRELFDASLV